MLRATRSDSHRESGGLHHRALRLVEDDDIALIRRQDQSQTRTVAEYLNANAKALFIDKVLSDDELELKCNDPKHDSRTPDIIVQPQYGTVYTTSKKKNAEHGGLRFADTNVALIVSNPRIRSAVLRRPWPLRRLRRQS